MAPALQQTLLSVATVDGCWGVSLLLPLSPLEGEMSAKLTERGRPLPQNPNNEKPGARLPPRPGFPK